MRLSKLQTRLLVGVYRVAIALRGAGPVPVPAFSGAAKANRQAAEAFNARVADAAAGIVAHEPAEWLERPLDPADRVSVSRALRSLQAKGLLALRPRVADGVRRFAVGAVELTPAGEDLAKRITAGTSPADTLAPATCGAETSRTGE